MYACNNNIAVVSLDCYVLHVIVTDGSLCVSCVVAILSLSSTLTFSDSTPTGETGEEQSSTCNNHCTSYLTSCSSLICIHLSNSTFELTPSLVSACTQTNQFQHC